MFTKEPSPVTVQQRAGHRLFGDQTAQHIQFHQVTVSGKGQARGISEPDPVQRELFEALKLEVPTRTRLETAL